MKIQAIYTWNKRPQQIDELDVESDTSEARLLVELLHRYVQDTPHLVKISVKVIPPGTGQTPGWMVHDEHWSEIGQDGENEPVSTYWEGVVWRFELPDAWSAS